MGTSLNLSIVGFVGNDPQIRTVETVNGEQQVATFSMAVSRKTSTGQKQTLWVRINCWRNLSTVAMDFIHKGSLVQVTAEWMRHSAWVDQNGNPQAGIDIDANRLILLDRVDAAADQVGEG